jgi:hypothetical protein
MKTRMMLSKVLALLEEQNPYAGAPIHREEQFRDSILVKEEERVKP